MPPLYTIWKQKARGDGKMFTAEKTSEETEDTEERVSLSIRLPRSLHARITEGAKREDRPLNRQIIRYLEKALSDESRVGLLSETRSPYTTE